MDSNVGMTMSSRETSTNMRPCSSRAVQLAVESCTPTSSARRMMAETVTPGAGITR